jgi:hypothetical protein
MRQKHLACCYVSAPSGHARVRSVGGMQSANYRKKSGHDIIATKMAAQKASTAQFE